MLKNANRFTEKPLKTDFLPDFSGFDILFSLLLLTELAAIILSLSAQPADFWSDLGGRSLFMQWIALGSAALLTLLRQPLLRLGERWSGLLVFLLVQSVSLLTNWLVYLGLPELGWYISLLSPEQIPAVLMRNMVISSIIVAVLLRYLYVHAHWQRQTKMEAEARLDALQARMRPHFLFNSLNTIASLLPARPQEAEELILDLADLFRTSLRHDQRWSTLTEEIALSRRYLNIEQQRLGPRLRVDWQIDELPVDALLPPLSLQPLVENAVYHGIELSAQGGDLSIVGSRRNSLLCITVTNPMVKDTPRRSGNRHALDNLRARWAACFAQDGAVELRVDDSVFSVSLIFPYKTN